MGDVMFSYTESKPGTVRTRRQVARYKYMHALQEQYDSGHGKYHPSELSSLADRWWPDTMPTKYEAGME